MKLAFVIAILSATLAAGSPINNTYIISEITSPLSDNEGKDPQSAMYPPDLPLSDQKCRPAFRYCIEA